MAETAIVETPSVTVPETYPQVQAEEWFEEIREEPRTPTPKGTQKPEPVVPPAPEKPKHKHARWMERAAIKMGLTDEEIEQTPSDVLGERIIQASDRKSQEAAAAALAEDRGRGKPASREEEKPDLDPYAKFGLDLEAGWDEGFLRTWSAMVEHIKAQDAKIAQLQGAANQFQAVQAQTVQQQIEGFFQKHGDVYMPGGERDDFKCEAVMNMLNSFLRQGKQTTLMADLQRAHSGLFGTRQQPTEPAPAPDPSRQAIRDAYENGGLTRPTQRNAAPLPKGRAAAVEFATKYMQEHSLGVSEAGDDPEGTLP